MIKLFNDKTKCQDYVTLLSHITYSHVASISYKNKTINMKFYLPIGQYVDIDQNLDYVYYF